MKKCKHEYRFAYDHEVNYYWYYCIFCLRQTKKVQGDYPEEDKGKRTCEPVDTSSFDGNRSNNELSNLRLIENQSAHASIEDVGKRNPNGQFVATEPIFKEIKFRLHDKDKNLTQIYPLQELIATTFRRGKFQFRGRWTGLKDKNGKEIYEGDIVKGIDGWEDNKGRDSNNYLPKIYSVKWEGSELVPMSQDGEYLHFKSYWWEVIGNIYENPDFIKSS